MNFKKIATTLVAVAPFATASMPTVADTAIIRIDSDNETKLIFSQGVASEADCKRLGALNASGENNISVTTCLNDNNEVYAGYFCKNSEVDRCESLNKHLGL